MKKIAVLFLVLALVFSFAACETGTSGDEEKKPSDSTQSNVENNENENKNNEGGATVTFTETVVVDNEQCAVKITGIDPDNMWGYTLKVLLENKSADKTYMFTVDTASINGVQTEPLFAATVAPGKKSNESITFMGDELKENGITEYTDIELNFRVYDNDDYMADDVANTTAHVYPYGEDKAVKFVRAAQDSDTVLVDNEYVTAIVIGYEEDEIWGYSVKLFLLNKTDKNVMFTTEDTSVNGFMADPLFATTVSAGKCKFDTLLWIGDDFEENNITEVETIEFKLRAYDSDDWFAGDLASQTVTLNP